MTVESTRDRRFWTSFGHTPKASSNRHYPHIGKVLHSRPLRVEPQSSLSLASIYLQKAPLALTMVDLAGRSFSNNAVPMKRRRFERIIRRIEEFSDSVIVFERQGYRGLRLLRTMSSFRAL